MKVVWVQHANERLGSIFDFIELDSRFRAAEFCERLLHATELLEEHPLAGPILPEDSAYRQLVVDTYRIVYRVADKIIYVVTAIAPGMTYDHSL